VQLVDDSDPAKALFKALKGQIPADAEEILFQAAHLESHQLQYQKARKALQMKKKLKPVEGSADEDMKEIE